MNVDDTDLIERLHAVAQGFQMPPGAPYDDVRRGRRRVHRNRGLAVAAAAAVAIAAVVAGGLTTRALRGSDRIAPIHQPTVNQSAEPAADDDPFATQLRTIVAQAPGWTLTDTATFGSDSSFAVCAGDWGAGGGGGGTMNLGTTAEPVTAVGVMTGVRSAANASKAVARLADNLESCTDYSWQTRAIEDTGAVLAYSDDGVVWIHHRGPEISTLEVGTSDGPPPPAVQIEVADLMWSDLGNKR